jgi:large subunit ribosomal protein L24
MHIRINDIVQVIAGDDKGKRGKVLSVDRQAAKVTVQGVNLVYRHMKPSRNNPQGGRLSKEMPLDASNVQLIDPSTNKPTRVGTRYNPDGSKQLIAKKTGTMIRVLSKANPKYAKKS